MGKTDDETVCSFCGMSHLMYKEMRTKDKRIAELEKQLAGTERLHAAAAKNTAESKQHYAQLKQMQESCAEQLAGLTDAQRKLAASEAEAARLRVELSVSREEAADAARAREADAEKWAAERRTLETASASRVQALEAPKLEILQGFLTPADDVDARGKLRVCFGVGGGQIPSYLFARCAPAAGCT